MNEFDIKYNEIEDLDYCLELLKKRDKKIKVLENIIKEVREYLDSIKEKQKVVGVYTKDIHKHILEILDKVEE